jgi:hypothetical protein
VTNPPPRGFVTLVTRIYFDSNINVTNCPPKGFVTLVAWIYLDQNINVTKGMFPLGIRSDVSKSVNNESSLKLHLNSLLILLLTSLLTLGGNIP